MQNYKSIEEILQEKGSFVWSTTGTSMRPLLKTKRDVVEISDPKSVYEDGILRVNDVALYRPRFSNPDGQYVLHRVRKVCDGYYILCGDNNVLREKVPFDWVVGVMTGLTRRGKNVDLNGFAYRMYVKHWGSRYRRRIKLKRFFYPIRKKLRPAVRRIKKLFKRR